MITGYLMNKSGETDWKNIEITRYNFLHRKI
ncbi:hypothetical protein NSB1T_13420 [Coprobacter fastidiosus NSB1 = JCM 33896]|nr:hypothetical protein NSB1T_13420 [Coprobacter fastidiosus NSB1 = JCM 33896]